MGHEIIQRLTGPPPPPPAYKLEHKRLACRKSEMKSSRSAAHDGAYGGAPGQGRTVRAHSARFGRNESSSFICVQSY